MLHTPASPGLCKHPGPTLSDVCGADRPRTADGIYRRSEFRPSHEYTADISSPPTGPRPCCTQVIARMRERPTCELLASWRRAVSAVQVSFKVGRAARGNCGHMPIFVRFGGSSVSSWKSGGLRGSRNGSTMMGCSVVAGRGGLLVALRGSRRITPTPVLAAGAFEQQSNNKRAANNVHVNARS